MNQEVRRSEKRHALSSRQRFQVKVCRGQQGDEEASELTATILDISLGGIKLESDSGFEFQEKIVLEIPRAEGKPPIRVAAQVRWVQPDSSGKLWHAGCLIAEEFPQDYINEIATNGLLNRRRSPRRKIEQGAVGRWELSQEDFPVSILDVSSNGVQLLAKEKGELGKRIRINFKNQYSNTEQFTAKSVWQQEVDNGVLIGCEVTDGSPYSLLDLAIQNEQIEQEIRTRSYKTLAFGGLSLCLVLIIRQIFF